MAYVASDIDTIDQAIKSGEKLLQYADGRRMEYRTVDDLKAARRLAVSEVAAAAGERRPAAFRLNVRKAI
jgi:hypothetical protein